MRRFLKGVFINRPSLPKYSVTWDVNLVLRHIGQGPFPHELSDNQLASFLATILALLSGQRGQTIHSLLIGNISLKLNCLCLKFGDLLKQSRPGYHLAEISLPVYTENPRICPVVLMREYLSRSREKRGQERRLFITNIRPFRAISRDTLHKWIKSTLAESGVDTGIFSAHSTRSASVCASKVSLDTNLRTAGWSSDSTYRKHYNKPVWQGSSFAESIQRNVFS